MIERVNVLGVGVSAVNMREALTVIDSWIENGEHQYVCVVPAHSIMDAYQDPEVRQILNESGLTTPDGMSLVWLLRARGYNHVDRVYGPDLLHAVCARSVDRGYRHYFYGGEPGVADDLAAAMTHKYPGLKVVGTYSPPFRELTEYEDRASVERINEANADFVWIGISSPRQDIWMAEHLDRIDAPVMIAVGAAFDFVSGHKKQAPVWVQRSGLEWLYRFTHEPRRLWRRYVKYPLFAFLVFMQMIGLKKYPLPLKSSE